LRIRAAAAADQSTIVRLVREANINRMNLHWQNFLIAEEEGGAIVGIGQVKAHGDGSRELASMVVVPERRGQGIGEALIESLIAAHPGDLYLTCRRELRGYYERFGFRLLAEEEYTRFFKRLIPAVNLLARIARTRILVMRRVG